MQKELARNLFVRRRSDFWKMGKTWKKSNCCVFLKSHTSKTFHQILTVLLSFSEFVSWATKCHQNQKKWPYRFWETCSKHVIESIYFLNLFKNSNCICNTVGWNTVGSTKFHHSRLGPHNSKSNLASEHLKIDFKLYFLMFTAFPVSIHARGVIRPIPVRIIRNQRTFV